MSKCCNSRVCFSTKNTSYGKTINPILRFIIGLATGVAFGLFIRQWMKENRQRGLRDLDLTYQEVPLEVPQPRGSEPELVQVEEINMAKMSRGGSNISTKASLPEGEISSEDCSPALETRPYYYISAVLENLEACEQAWGEPAYVRFVTTGKGIKPGYQIKAVSGVNFQTFAGRNHVQRSPNQRLSNRAPRTPHLTTKKYTKEDLLAAIECTRP